MRLWSIHPKYLDRQGLLALWRESLLAKKVLEGKTKGYRKHPQLERFRAHPKPLEAINYYLSVVFEEAKRRGYKFSKDKFAKPSRISYIPVSLGQIKFEFMHLKKKLKKRDLLQYKKMGKIKRILWHPIIKVFKGSVEKWERR
jgi:hypothetical protein